MNALKLTLRALPLFALLLTVANAQPFGMCDAPDGTFLVPTMSAASNTDPLQRNDDGVSGPIALGFTFEFFGGYYTSIYINNNGNVTLNAPYAPFTASGFPFVGPKMIAPFWGDVDTRNVLSGVVRYKIYPHRITVAWEAVGYYNSHVDKLNSFEVMLSDGMDPLVGIGQNVCFCYGNMDWTTGDASAGAGGFGGAPATVGINVGDGINFIQTGRFDQPGFAYDGPMGANDGVDWLDGQFFCFNVGGCGQKGQVGLNDFTINGSFSGASSGLCVNIASGSNAQIAISTLPFAGVTLLCAPGCICPGLVTPFGELHLPLPLVNCALFDGCGIFGPPDSFAVADSSGNLVLNFAVPIGIPPFCICVQGVLCHPAVLGSYAFTQAYKVCIL